MQRSVNDLHDAKDNINYLKRYTEKLNPSKDTRKAYCRKVTDCG